MLMLMYLHDTPCFFHIGFDFRLIASNNICRFYIFLLFLEDFLVPYFIQGVKCFFLFNLILATGKHSSYSESIMLKKLMYASLPFLHVLALLQFISNNLNWEENLCLYISFFIASSFSAMYLYQKKTGKWSEMSVFIIPDLKPMCII